MLTAGYAALFLIDINTKELAYNLYYFKALCNESPTLSYAIFSVSLCAVLFTGLPVASALMLLAGVVYSFWEAATLITICRLGVAVSAFSISKGYFAAKQTAYETKAGFLRKVEEHPYISLLLMRLAPLPDSMINYSMSAVPVKTRNYALVSFVGMIPATMLIVMAGAQIGNISSFISQVS